MHSSHCGTHETVGTLGRPGSGPTVPEWHSRYDIRLFTLGDLRQLSGESRTLFHAISAAYRSQSFATLTPSMATILMNILVGYEHEHAVKSDRHS